MKRKRKVFRLQHFNVVQYRSHIQWYRLVSISCQNGICPSTYYIPSVFLFFLKQ